MNHMIEAVDVPGILIETLPEFRPSVEEHQREWPDDPMLYLIVGALFQRMVDMSEGSERLDFVRRVYTLTEIMLTNGAQCVRDCFAIELIEPLSGENSEQSFPGLEIAIGEAGRKELAFMREWARLYGDMKIAIERANQQLGCTVFEGVGIGEGNASTRVIVNLPLWESLTEHQRDDAHQRLSSDWESVSGSASGVTISGPRETSFRVLRG
jgi:hypothetical protein